MYIPLSDDKHRFVQKIHSTRANGHWEHGRNSNPVATLPHAAVVLYATIKFNYLMPFYTAIRDTEHNHDNDTSAECIKLSQIISAHWKGYVAQGYV